MNVPKLVLGLFFLAGAVACGIAAVALPLSEEFLPLFGAGFLGSLGAMQCIEAVARR